MKFSVAWANIISENAILKTVVLALSGVILFFGFSLLQLALRDPLVIERGCYSKVAATKDGKRTPEEAESFLRLALAQRFDSDANPRNAYLSNEEQIVREKEQKELKNRKLLQKIVVNAVTLNGGVANVDADRLISVGEIRSAFRFPLVVKLESIERTEGNPYGLVVDEVKALEKGDK